MAILDRLFGSKSGKAGKGGTGDLPPPLPWSVIVADNGDVCVAIESFTPHASGVSLVFNPEFHDEVRALAPIRLLATRPDGRVTLHLLAPISPEAVERVVKSPSVLVCETGRIGIENLHHAPVFIDEVGTPLTTDGQPLERRAPRVTAASYDATVLKVLDEGDALHGWKGVVQLEIDGTVAAEKSLLALYPAPCLKDGDRVEVYGTLEHPELDGTLPSMESDAVYPVGARLTKCSFPTRYQVAASGGSRAVREASLDLVRGTVATLAALACDTYGYVQGSLRPYLRDIGQPVDPVVAGANDRFAERTVDRSAAAMPVLHPDRPRATFWNLRVGPGDLVRLSFEKVSNNPPAEASVLIHEEPQLARHGVGSPVAVLLRYEDGTKRRLIFTEMGDEVVDHIRRASQVRVVELHGKVEVASYPANVRVQKSRVIHAAA